VGSSRSRRGGGSGLVCRGQCAKGFRKRGVAGEGKEISQQKQRREKYPDPSPNSTRAVTPGTKRKNKRSTQQRKKKTEAKEPFNQEKNPSPTKEAITSRKGSKKKPQSNKEKKQADGRRPFNNEKNSTDRRGQPARRAKKPNELVKTTKKKCQKTNTDGDSAVVQSSLQKALYNTEKKNKKPEHKTEGPWHGRAQGTQKRPTKRCGREEPTYSIFKKRLAPRLRGVQERKTNYKRQRTKKQRPPEGHGSTTPKKAPSLNKKKPLERR